MKKEVFITVLLGLGMGFLVAFGVYRMRLVETPSQSAQRADTVSEVQSSPTGSVVTVVNPPDGLVVTELSTIVTGSTIPDTPLVLLVNNTEYISAADATGNFSIEVTLTEGSNVLTLYVLENDGDSVIDQRTVIVARDLPELTPAPAATSSGN